MNFKQYLEEATFEYKSHTWEHDIPDLKTKKFEIVVLPPGLKTKSKKKLAAASTVTNVDYKGLIKWLKTNANSAKFMMDSYLESLGHSVDGSISIFDKDNNIAKITIK